MSRRFPRLRRKLSRTCTWSRLSRANRPTPNSPSMVVPHVPQRRRVTASSPEQTGQVAMTSWGTSGTPCSKRTFAFIRSTFLIVNTSNETRHEGRRTRRSPVPLGTVQPGTVGVACNVLDTPRHTRPVHRDAGLVHGVQNSLEGAAMAILDRIRDRNGITIDLGDMTDRVRDHAPETNGIHPVGWAGDAAGGVSDAAKDAADAAKGAMKDASDTVKDASDVARERIETIGEVIRDAIREWSKTSNDRRVDARLDDIAQRLRSAMPSSTFKGAVTRLERELPDTDKDRYDRAYERGRVQTRTLYVVGGLAVGIGAGIAASVLLDPQRGQQRRAQISKLRDQVTRQVSERSRDLTTRAKSMAAERGIGQPAQKPADPVGVTDRDMVPVMPVGDGPVTDPSSILREPLPGAGGDIEPEPLVIAEPSTADGTGDRAVTASHG